MGRGGREDGTGLSEEKKQKEYEKEEKAVDEHEENEKEKKRREEKEEWKEEEKIVLQYVQIAYGEKDEHDMHGNRRMRNWKDLRGRNES